MALPRSRRLIGGSRSLAHRLVADAAIAEAAVRDFSRFTSASAGPLEQIEHMRTRNQWSYLDSLAEITPSRGIGYAKLLYQLNSLKRSYIDELRHLNRNLPPMHEKCRLSVVVAAANEGKNIRRTLADWTVNQHRVANPNEYELIVFVNKPNSASTWDETAREVARFKQRHPQYRIHMVQKEFNFPEQDMHVNLQGWQVKVEKGVKMGLVFKTAYDLALLRNLMRERGDAANHLIATSAGDVVARHPKFVRWLLATAKNQPHVDFVNFSYDFPPATAHRTPLLWVFHRFRSSLADAYHDTAPRRHGAIRAGKYAEVGGFNPSVRVAEEVDLGRRLLQSRARQYTQPFVGVVDSPRRSLLALLLRQPIIAEYRTFDRRDLLEKLEKSGADVMPPYAELTPDSLTREVNSYFKSYLFKMKRSKTPGWYRKGAAMLHTALRSVGLKPVDYDVSPVRAQDGRITSADVRIKNLDGVLKLLRQRHEKTSASWLARAPPL